MSQLPDIGDLAEVVFSPCRCHDRLLGHRLMVTRIRPSKFAAGEVIYHIDCGASITMPAGGVCEDRSVQPICSYPRAWMRKVPPLAELEIYDTEEKINA